MAFLVNSFYLRLIFVFTFNVLNLLYYSCSFFVTKERTKKVSLLTKNKRQMQQISWHLQLLRNSFAAQTHTVLGKPCKCLNYKFAYFLNVAFRPNSYFR